MKTRLEELQMMLLDDPNDLFLGYAIGLELFKMGSVDEAVETIKNLTVLHPDYIPAYFRLGQWYAEQDKMMEAKKVLNQALELSKQQNDSKAGQEIRELLIFIEDYED